jgi:antitoxin VapB
MRPLQAHCHLGLGTLYTRTGQREQARAALSMAIGLYRAMDMHFWLPGTEVYIKKVGNAIVLLPMDQPWDTLWESLTHFSEDFMSERDQPPVQRRDDAFAS